MKIYEGKLVSKEAKIAIVCGRFNDRDRKSVV